MDIRPVDLPELRDETRRDVAARYPEIYEAEIRRGDQFWRPLMAPGPAAVHMVNAEVARLGVAELFYVSSQMAELALSAARTMPDFSLAPEDLPAESGFIYFDSPIDSFLNDDGSRIEIVAASWGTWHDAPPGYPHGGVWITWYSDREANLLGSPISADPEVRRRVRQRTSRFLLHTETPAPFHSQDISAVDEDGSVKLTSFREAISVGASLLLWVAALKATWLLMQQSLADVSEVSVPRSRQKRLRRAGYEPKPVRVIELRRPAHSGPGDGSREFHHQWIVRGHWRQQWYPAREVHRPVWIAPHIKGPEGAPLLGGEKVYAWKR